MKVFSILLPSLLINFISCRGIAINNDMFNFYVFISILIQFLFAFKSSRAKELEFTIPGNYSSSYLHIQNPPKKKSDLFKLGTVKQLTDDEKYKLKYNFASGRFCRKKSYLNKNQIFNCKDNPEFTAYIGNKITCGAAVPTKKLNDTIQNTFLSAQNATVHTLKDLIHKHIMNHINQSNLMLKNGTSSITVNVTEFEVSTTVSHQTFNNVYSNNSHSSPLYQTKHMVHNTALRFIKPTINSVNNNPGAIKGLFKYHDRKRSSIETFPNMTKHQRPRAFTNNQIQFYLRNEHGNRFNVSSGDISTKINIEKNPKNNSVKEIMIIEIPMKSPPDKNVLLDLNDFPLVKPSSDDESKRQEEITKDIEKKVEANIVKYLDQFKRDIVTSLTELIDHKKYDAVQETSMVKSSSCCPMKSINLTRKRDEKINNIQDNFKSTTREEDVDASHEHFIFHTTESTIMTDINSNVNSNNNKEIIHNTAFNQSEIIPNNILDVNHNIFDKENLSLPNIQIFDRNLVSVFKTEHPNVSTNDVIATYDIDLKHPNQLFLVPKDFLQKMRDLNISATEVQQLNKLEVLAEATNYFRDRLLNMPLVEALKHIKDKYNRSNIEPFQNFDDFTNRRLKSNFYLPQRNISSLCTSSNCILCGSTTPFELNQSKSN